MKMQPVEQSQTGQKPQQQLVVLSEQTQQQSHARERQLPAPQATIRQSQQQIAVQTQSVANGQSIILPQTSLPQALAYNFQEDMNFVSGMNIDLGSVSSSSLSASVQQQSGTQTTESRSEGIGNLLDVAPHLGISTVAAQAYQQRQEELELHHINQNREEFIESSRAEINKLRTHLNGLNGIINERLEGEIRDKLTRLDNALNERKVNSEEEIKRFKRCINSVNKSLSINATDYEAPLRLRNIIAKLNNGSFNISDAAAILEMCNKRRAYSDSQDDGHSNEHVRDSESNEALNKEAHGLFLDQDQQDILFLHALQTVEAENALTRLLNSNTNIRETIAVQVPNGHYFIRLHNGVKQTVGISAVVCVFDKVGNRLHVQTFYPIGW